MNTRLSVLIVNYRSADLTARCISSIAGYPVEILVCDNSDREDEFDQLTVALKDFPSVVTVRSKGNIGFGAAINRLASRAFAAGADAVWVLNPDTVVREGCLRALLNALEQDPEALLSPVLSMTDDDNPLVWFAGGDVDLVAGRVSHRSYGVPLSNTSVADGVTFLTGAALVIPAGVWRRIGPLREDLFLYWEDVEYSIRAVSAGVELKVVSDAIVLHEEGGTSGRQGVRSVANYRWTARNRLVVLAEHLDRRDWLRAFLSTETLKTALRPVLLHDAPLVKKTMAAVLGTVAGAATGWRRSGTPQPGI